MRGQPTSIDIDAVAGVTHGTLYSFVRLVDNASNNQRGVVRWVSVHTDAMNPVPRLHIGIEMDQHPSDAHIYDEQLDPVYTEEFVQHVQARESQLPARELDRMRLAARESVAR